MLNEQNFPFPNFIDCTDEVHEWKYNLTFLYRLGDNYDIIRQSYPIIYNIFGPRQRHTRYILFVYT